MFQHSASIGPIATRRRPAADRPYHAWPFIAGPRSLPAPRRHTPCPDAASLIADCGHPQWPGWQLVFVAMLATQMWLAVCPSDQPFTRNHRAAAVRMVVKIMRAPASFGRVD